MKQLVQRRPCRRAWFGSGSALVVCALLVGASPVYAQPAPTADNALAADLALARAMQANDSAGIISLLDKDWAVIATTGAIAEGPQVFPSGIASGYLTRTKFVLSEPRVRVFGDTAVVTSKVALAGVFKGKPFDVAERQTDVWVWRDGAWKCVLTHETKLTG